MGSGDRLPGRKFFWKYTDKSFYSNVNFNNVWSYNSNSPYAFIMDCSVNTATILTLIYRFLDRRKIKCNKPKQRNADKSLARPGRKQAKRQKILMFIYPIYNHNWRNFITIYIYNKTSIKRNILTIKQNTSGSRSG